MFSLVVVGQRVLVGLDFGVAWIGLTSHAIMGNIHILIQRILQEYYSINKLHDGMMSECRE